MFVQGKAQQEFDKTVFYKVLSGDNKADIDAQINLIQKSTFKEKSAYEGVLLMKKAGLLTKLKDKLSSFKAGRAKLEPAIESDKGNLEYRFFRLIIQENAPKVLGYNKELNEDSKLINANFSKLSQLTQQAVINYSKKSKTIKIPTHN